MRVYNKKPPSQDYFAQGFRWGLVFGALGALIMLGRRGKPTSTI
ncbi:MAG: hypothetical protein JWP00_1749 [Chloroflexi bacterium]|jgi:hypothetical protein|nr:hypothetical protein [Chloroflexota bacterium]